MSRLPLFGALVFGAALVFVSACTQSTPAGEDAAIMFELPDAGTDAGPPPTVIGNPCAEDTECGDTGLCFLETDGFAGGYCSAFCATDDECPGGSVCILTNDMPPMGFCYDECDPAATERECRALYGCAAGPGIPAPVCIPGCTDDTDCPADRACNPTSGGRCYNPASAFGDPCERSTDCPDGGRCYSESRRGYPGGMCVAFGCDPDANTGCPGDFQCIPGGRSGFGRCIDGCAIDDDCRGGYACAAAEGFPDRLVCTPACTSDADCTGGRTCDVAAGTC